MAKYGALELEIKIFESKMKPSPTVKGGVYQVIGNCHAVISLAAAEVEEGQEEVPGLNLFPDFSGSVARFYKTVEDFENGVEPRIIVDYSNSYKNAAGQYVDQTRPSQDVQAMLEVETMKVFIKGFTKSDREENTAAAAGMEMSEYTELMNSAISAAAAVEGELQTPEEKAEAGKASTKSLDEAIG